MARRFKVEIVTPEKIVFSEEAESLVVPAERGYLGVLAGHAPLLCTLRAGEISIRGEKGEVHFSTAGGFMEVTPQKASLLTESAEEVAAIDAERARKALERARERLGTQDKALDRERARASVERAQNRLKLASKYKKP
jgi:F-type H+-transporting ATPase subunit epsilon